MTFRLARTATAAAALVMVAIAAPAAVAGPDREITDKVGDAPKSVDLKAMRTTDGENPTIVVSARGLPKKGRLSIAFAEWDENWYRLHLRKTPTGLKKTLLYFDPETGDTQPFNCNYMVKWRGAKHRVNISFVRDSCFYEEPGDQYTGFAPQWAELSSKAGADRLEQTY